MRPMIRLGTTLTGEMYVTILSDLLHSFMFISHSDGLGKFQLDSATPHTSIIATERLRGTLLNLDTSAGQQNPHTWALLNISKMPCNVIFRRDLQPLLLLMMYRQPCRIHGVSYLHHYFRH
ncbi:uncharacterized protein TNCV_3243571 [Trichonephila clavipes]|nr:uncharacterized protein TNCV_3243571 [Trichonephila clavipes]